MAEGNSDFSSAAFSLLSWAVCSRSAMMSFCILDARASARFISSGFSEWSNQNYDFLELGSRYIKLERKSFMTKPAMIHFISDELHEVNPVHQSRHSRREMNVFNESISKI
jgi:hypothetical protein